MQVTGVEADSRAAQLTLSAIKALKAFASFDGVEPSGDSAEQPPTVEPRPRALELPTHQGGNGQVGLNLSYTINLNLPATADQAVFNAIFRSLKEHLLSGYE